MKLKRSEVIEMIIKKDGEDAPLPGLYAEMFSLKELLAYCKDIEWRKEVEAQEADFRDLKATQESVRM